MSALSKAILTAIRSGHAATATDAIKTALSEKVTAVLARERRTVSEGLLREAREWEITFKGKPAEVDALRKKGFKAIMLAGGTVRVVAPDRNNGWGAIQVVTDIGDAIGRKLDNWDNKVLKEERTAFAVTFKRNGKETTWTRFYDSQEDADDDAPKVIKKEYPDGSAKLVSVKPTKDPRSLKEGYSKVAIIRDPLSPIGQPGRMYLVCPHDRIVVDVPGAGDVQCPKCGQKFDSRGYLKESAPPVGWDKGFGYPWRVGAGGSETPFLHNGKWFLYVYNAKTGKHAYYSYDDDMYLQDYRTGALVEGVIKEGDYDQAVSILSGNIANYIKSAKKDGTLGMSKANLRQVVSSRGVNLPNANAFARAFDDAIKTAAGAKNFIYEADDDDKETVPVIDVYGLDKKPIGGRRKKDITEDKIPGKKGDKYVTCPECESSFPSSSLKNGKLPPHREFNGTGQCSGTGMLGEGYLKEAEKVALKCNECGKSFKVSPNNLDPQCPKCGGVDYDVRSEQTIHEAVVTNYGSWKVLKTIPSHSGYSRFLAELGDEPAGWFEMPKDVPSPYLYSKYRRFFKWNGKRVFVAETSHKVYRVIELPAGVKTYDHDPSMDNAVFTESLDMPLKTVQRVFDENGDVSETEILCGIRSLKVNPTGSVLSYVNESAESSTRYVVVNDNILGYIYPEEPNTLGILHASPLRGATAKDLDGTTTLKGSDKVRSATLADFKAFRVVPPPGFKG